MSHIGQYNTLKVIRQANQGTFLDGEELGELLLPAREAPSEVESGEEMEVFLYHGPNGELTPTILKPLGTAETFAYLRVTAVSTVGAFLNWGLPKDILVPFREQMTRLVEGKYYTVYIYLDKKSDRIVATTKIEKYLDKTPAFYKEGEKVDLLIWGKSEIGIKAIINNAHWGMLYENEIFQELKCGERLTGYIKTLRDDHKIDLMLHPPGYQKVEVFSETILSVLKACDGYLPLTDKSSPNEIYQKFGVSKKTYKKAIGALYKQKLISIESDGIRLND